MNPKVVALARKVDQGALARHLAALPAPRAPGDPGHASARAYVREQFASYDWEVREQRFVDGVNVIGTRRGSGRGLVVVGAHYDTVPGSPGADDNGSGVAGLLEVARLLGTERVEAAVELVAFDQEENGFLGSQAYAASVQRNGFRDAIVFEMIGYADRRPGSQGLPPGIELVFPQEVERLIARGRPADFIAVLGSDRDRLLDEFVRWAKAGAPDLAMIALRVPSWAGQPELFLSDHVSFWERSLPALQLTDTAMFRTPHYHLSGDRPETLDAAFWRQVVAATVAAAAGLAGMA